MLGTFVLCGACTTQCCWPGTRLCCCWLWYVFLVVPCTLDLCGSEGIILHRVSSSFSLLQFLTSAAWLSKCCQSLARIKLLPPLGISCGGVQNMQYCIFIFFLPWCDVLLEQQCLPCTSHGFLSENRFSNILQVTVIEGETCCSCLFYCALCICDKTLLGW